jgi:2-polyprenyl-3-methyl-5-hydroxy-6-metoxy-1,4-benzoquinol methylase
MENLNQCLVCQNTHSTPFLQAQDHFTKEYFDLKKCSSCGFVYTDPRPSVSEIGKYYAFDAYLSHSSHKKSLLSTVYRAARNYMLGKKYNMIAGLKALDGKSLLDYGCGTADFLGYCKSKGLNVNGYEVDQNARKTAEQVNGIKPLGPDELGSIQPASFDVISLWHVLEHVHNLNAQISDFKTWLRPDGLLAIAVPNLASYDAEKYNAKWAGLDVPRHLYHFTPDTIKKLMLAHGLTCVSTFPLVLDSFYVSMYSEWNSPGSKLLGLVRAFFAGLKSNIKASSSGNYSSLVYIFKVK